MLGVLWDDWMFGLDEEDDWEDDNSSVDLVFEATLVVSVLVISSVEVTLFDVVGFLGEEGTEYTEYLINLVSEDSSLETALSEVDFDGIILSKNDCILFHDDEGVLSNFSEDLTVSGCFDGACSSQFDDCWFGLTASLDATFFSEDDNSPALGVSLDETLFF